MMMKSGFQIVTDDADELGSKMKTKEMDELSNQWKNMILDLDTLELVKEEDEVHER